MFHFDGIFKTHQNHIYYQNVKLGSAKHRKDVSHQLNTLNIYFIKSNTVNHITLQHLKYHRNTIIVLNKTENKT